MTRHRWVTGWLHFSHCKYYTQYIDFLISDPIWLAQLLKALWTWRFSLSPIKFTYVCPKLSTCKERIDDQSRWLKYTRLTLARIQANRHYILPSVHEIRKTAHNDRSHHNATDVPSHFDKCNRCPLFRMRLMQYGLSRAPLNGKGSVRKVIPRGWGYGPLCGQAVAGWIYQYFIK
jgi:hypothetical protein